ncbi:MAG: glycosyltransferase [Thermodesulforhabdaceae bacterium]
MLELTVIIPTYNRADILKDCLIALSEQTLETNCFEVIVGDDGSSDHTQKVLRWAESNMPYKLKWFTQKNAGPNRVRNKSIEMSESPVVVFFNDDTIATPSLLTQHLRAHKNYPQINIAFLGKVTIDPVLPYSPFALLHLDSSFGQWDRLVNSDGFALLDWRAFYTCNLSVKRNFLLENGLFDEDIRYSDDVELGARLDSRGLKILYCPDALGYHRHFLTESDYLRIAEKEGIGLAVWYMKRSRDCHYLKELRFPLCISAMNRLRFLIGDLTFHRSIRWFWLRLARKMVGTTRKNVGLRIYEKLYQAIKREAIFNQIRKN